MYEGAKDGRKDETAPACPRLLFLLSLLLLFSSILLACDPGWPVDLCYAYYL